MNLKKEARLWKKAHVRVEFGDWLKTPAYVFYISHKGVTEPLIDIRDILEARKFAGNLRRLGVTVNDSEARWTALSSR